MKKNTLIAIIALLVLVGGLTYLKTKSQSPKSPATTTNSTKPTQQAKTKISDWLKKKSSVVCTIENNGQKTTIYIKGDKIRVDGMTTSTQNQKSYYIQDDKYAYIWTDGKPNGTKYPLKSFLNDNEDDSETNTNAPQKFDLKEMEAAWEGMNYKCTPKNIPDSNFTPPSNIKFVDLENMFQQMQQNLPNFQPNQ